MNCNSSKLCAQINTSQSINAQHHRVRAQSAVKLMLNVATTPASTSTWETVSTDSTAFFPTLSNVKSSSQNLPRSSAANSTTRITVPRATNVGSLTISAPNPASITLLESVNSQQKPAGSPTTKQ